MKSGPTEGGVASVWILFNFDSVLQYSEYRKELNLTLRYDSEHLISWCSVLASLTKISMNSRSDELTVVNDSIAYV